MKWIFLGFIVLLHLFSCNSSTISSDENSMMQDSVASQIKKEPVQDCPPAVDLATHQEAYLRRLAHVEKRRIQLSQTYQGANDKVKALEMIGDSLHHILVEEIFPFWYGTIWDFNGYTAKPRDGVVACGYFVSTPLKQIGFKLNRYKLAQQAAANIVKSLCVNEKAKTLSTIEQMLAYFKTQDDGLYVVGLTSHVGFIEKKNQEVYFIHSNYEWYPCNGVVKEKVLASTAISHSDIFVIGSISQNEILLKRWLTNGNIPIVGE